MKKRNSSTLKSTYTRNLPELAAPTTPKFCIKISYTGVKKLASRLIIARGDADDRMSVAPLTK